MMKIKSPVLMVCFVLVLFCSSALADVEVDWGAFVENDLRAAVARVDTPEIYRNQTTLGADIKVNLLPDKLRFVGDLRFVWVGFTQDTDYLGLTSREVISPYYLESNAAYIDAINILPGMDLRVGRQIVNWGAADMFNPTNNLNALDLEDPLAFGETIANEMIKLDWGPGDNFLFTGVWVPVFQPAQLPKSGLLAVGDTTSEFPFSSPYKRMKAENLRKIWLRSPDQYVIDEPDITIDVPEFSLSNSQFAFKLQWAAGLFDMSLSYYQGRESMPVTIQSISASYNSPEKTPQGWQKLGVTSDVILTYAKKKVLGFDLAGQIPFLDDMGFWFEGAFVFPEQMEMIFDLSAIVPDALPVVGDTVSSDAYFKCTTGFDYSVGPHLFITGQFIHGFADEFGAANQNNYWIGGADMKFLQERLLFRMFALGEIPHKDSDLTLDMDHDGRVDSSGQGATNDGTIAAYVLYPQVTVKPMDGLDLTLIGYFPIGHKESKFAQPAAGPSQVVFRARASF